MAIKKRLTVSVDKETIALAKQLAAENNTTVSKLFVKRLLELAESQKMSHTLENDKETKAS